MCYNVLSDVKSMLSLEVEHMTAKITLVNANDMIRRYVAGESEYALANSLHVARECIRRHLIHGGITPRGCSDAALVRASKMSPEARSAQAAAAHVAATGRRKPFEESCRIAQGRELHGNSISDNERFFRNLLTERGIETIPQKAIGPYNCDLGAFPVAVEIFGGHWHWYGYHARVTDKRFRYILNAGYHILVVADYGRVPICEATADYAVTYIESMRSDPSARREYRVIRGAGELIASGSVDDEHISIVPTFTIGRNPTNGQYIHVPR